MKQPDLSYSYCYPFYTQVCSGQKRSFYKVETIMHMTDSRGILLSISYKQNKISEVRVNELANTDRLSYARESGTLIHYTAFAAEVNKVYRTLSGALRKLSPEKSYVKKLVFKNYFKYNSSIELEVDYKDIHATFGSFDYVIESGHIKRSKDALVTDDTVLNKLQAVVNAIDERTEFTEIDDQVFIQGVDLAWEYFTEYFKSPKFIKRNGYVLK